MIYKSGNDKFSLFLFLYVSQITFYHIGRLVAYGLIGLVFGLIGKSLFIFGFQQQLSIIIGVLMKSMI